MTSQFGCHSWQEHFLVAEIIEFHDLNSSPFKMVLTAGFVIVPGLVTLKQKGNLTILGGGYGDWFSSAFQKLACEFVMHTKTGDPKLLSNGTWTELFEPVQRGLIQLPFLYQPTFNSFQLVEPVITLTFGSFTILASKRIPSYSAAVLSPLVLSLLMISLLVASFAIIIFEKRPIKLLFRELLYMFQTLTYESHPLPPRSRRSRFILILWYFMMVIVLVNALIGYLTSTFSLATSEPAFKSYTDLIAYPTVKIMTNNGGFEGLKQVLGRKEFSRMKSHITIMKPRDNVQAAVLKKLRHHDYVHIWGMFTAQVVNSLYIKKFNKCNLYLSVVPGIGTSYFTFGLKKGTLDPGKGIRKTLLSFEENGFHARFHRQTTAGTEECTFHEKEVEPLNFQMLKPYFKFTLYGFGSSFVSFCLELICSRLKIPIFSQP